MKFILFDVSILKNFTEIMIKYFYNLYLFSYINRNLPMYFYKILMVKVVIIALKYEILQNTIIRINVPGALRNLHQIS